MLLRFPWLLSRKRLLGFLLIDGCLFLLLYFVAFLFRFGSWPEVSLPVGAFVSLWLLCSYVIGRYQAVPKEGQGGFLKLAFRTAAVLLISIGFYFSYFWVSSVFFGFKDPLGFLLPLMLGFATLSYTTQAFLAKAISSSSQSSQKWIFCGSRVTFDTVFKQLAFRRLPATIEFIPISDVLPTLRSGMCSGVLISDFNALPSFVEEHLLTLQQKGVFVWSVLSWCEHVLQRFPPELLSNADLLRGDFLSISPNIQLRLKRLGDVVVSVFLLLITAPILVLASIFIRLQDGGPVFYSQLRSGLGGKSFRVWKLRTMRVDAERHGPQWVSKADSRITPFGRLLRLTRVDELPQLWIVLMGDMSLIGPRPERPEIEHGLVSNIPHYRLRYLMRPGLSGWAQVNYPYGASLEDATNKLSYDLYYLRNFSLWLDLLILFKTIRIVFNAHGAVPK